MKESVHGISTALEQNYVYPQLGTDMSAYIGDKLLNGGYDNLYTNFGLIAQLNADLRYVSNDKHISLRPFSDDIGPGVSHANRAFSVEAELLQGNVGYLRLNSFPFGESARNVLIEAVSGFPSTEAIIIDLRSNGGGSTHQSAHFAAVFLDPGTPLWTYADRNGVITEKYHAEFIPGTELLKEVPLYVLTSKKTFSAAEYFVWAMKLCGRAKIIGERTGGGAHPIEDIQIEDLFTLRTPVAKPVIPPGEDSWQAHGIEPHLSTSAEQALSSALAIVVQRS